MPLLVNENAGQNASDGMPDGSAAFPLNISLMGGGGVGQGTTTSGQSGPLAQAAATTAAPSYANGTTNPLSLDAAGNLRVNVVTSGAGGGAITAADGAIVTIGSEADAAWSGTGGSTLVAVLKAIYTKLANVAQETGGNLAGIFSALGSPMQQTGGSLIVTNFPAIQPISAESLPLPAGAAQDTTVAGVTVAINAMAAQPVPATDMLRNYLLATQLRQSMSVPTNGFVPVEIPSVGL